MEIIITGKNIDVSDKMEVYVRRKVSRLERHLSKTAEARVELSRQKTKNAREREIAQVTMVNNGTIIRAEERAGEMHVAVDAVVDKLDKQVRRYKDKRVRRRRKPGAGAEAVELIVPETSPRIIRVKRFRTPPMREDEAVEQMELLGHSFFVFVNRTSGELNVVYRRIDGNYGVLEPQIN